MSLLDDVSIVVTPNGYKAGELYAVIPVPSEGADVIDNGDFATGTDWSLWDGGTIISNEMVLNCGVTTNAYTYQSKASAYTLGRRFQITIEIISNTTGTPLVLYPFSNSPNTSTISIGTLAGTYKINFTSDYSSGTGTTFALRALSSTGTLVIDNVSVKEYTAADMDVTRATAATRVDENGLVNYAEIVGDNLTTPLDFTTWSDIGATDITANSFTISGSGGGVSFNLTTNKLYKINVSGVTGDIGLRYRDGGGGGTVLGAFDTDLYFDTSGLTSPNLYLRSLSATTATVTSVSVKEVTRDNVPRIDYSGGGCPHILAEPQRRNLVTYSEVISSLSLLIGGAGTYTITDNYTDSPEGVQNASRIQMSIVDTNDSANYSLIALNSSMTTGVTREISFYAKSLTGLNQEVLVYWSSAKQIVTLTNDWQRFEISGTSASSSAVLIGTRGGNTQYYAGGDANLDFALWGLQVEDDGSGGGSSYATSYIPNFGTALGVTRNQDQFSRDGISSLINSEEGVLFVEMAALSNDSTNRMISLSDGTSNNYVLLSFRNQSNKIRYNYNVGSVGVVDISVAASDITEFNKVAVTWKLNEFKMYLNGVKVGEDLIGSVVSPNVINQITFDREGSLPFYGKVKQLQVYSTSLSDTQLASLTS